MSHRRNSSGVTLVELVIVVVIVAAILAILIPLLRERERQRLQAMANAEPWEVFEFRVRPAKEIFAEDEDIVVHCEIVNTTDYRLRLPRDLHKFHVVFGDTDYFAGIYRPQDAHWGMEIAPKKSALFDVTFLPIGTGVAEVRIAYEKDLTSTSANGNSITFVSTDSVEVTSLGDGKQMLYTQGSFGTPESPVRIAARYFAQAAEGTIKVTKLRGIFPGDKRRFQSDAFMLEVMESGSSELPTFDEVVVEIKRLE